MNYENIDIVFNNSGEVVYSSLPSTIKQYSNNYKLRVGFTSSLVNVKVITAMIKALTTLPARLLMLNTDKNAYIDANGVYVRNIYEYSFSQYDTKAFQDYMEITVNVQTEDNTIFNHTVSIPMTKTAYGESTVKLLEDDGSLNSFVSGVYTGISDFNKRLNILEAIVDPEQNTNNPAILENINSNIGQLYNELTTVNQEISNIKSAHVADITSINKLKYDKTGGDITGKVSVKGTNGEDDKTTISGGVLSAYQINLQGSANTKDIELMLSNRLTSDWLTIGPSSIGFKNQHNTVSFPVNTLSQLAYSKVLYFGSTYQGTTVLNVANLLPKVTSGNSSYNFRGAILTLKSSSPARYDDTGHCMYLFTTYYASSSIGWISTLTPITQESAILDSSRKVKMYLSDSTGAEVKDTRTPYVTVTITDTGYSFALSVIPIFW